jgi:hypothetical protein
MSGVYSHTGPQVFQLLPVLSTAFSGVFLITGSSHPASSRVLYPVSSNTFSPFRDFLHSGFYFVTGFSHLFIFPRLKVFSFQ